MTPQYKNHKQRVLNLLTEHADGLTVSQIAKLLDYTQSNQSAIRHLVKSHPLIYVDRWVATRRGSGWYKSDNLQWVPVYCIIQEPEDAPKPERKPTEADVL